MRLVEENYIAVIYLKWKSFYWIHINNIFIIKITNMVKRIFYYWKIYKYVCFESSIYMHKIVYYMKTSHPDHKDRKYWHF